MIQTLRRRIARWRCPGEPYELATLPVEVRQLVHAVDRMRDRWAETREGSPERADLWRRVHTACDAVWGRKDRA